ncbi:MAG TPA: FAD-dependent oxidoreductase [Solirubrobacteraceae bacterium]|nr:FAD-dependent oxidoreductase [Solirubrobacteraceae bacterium]
MNAGGVGYWWSSLGGPPPRRPPLERPREADVAIVGAGYTGLWCAYYLKRARPELEVVVLEREHAGFGASGRNGGWVSGFFSGPPRVYERAGAGADRGYGALQALMFETVEEIAAVLADRRIEADFLQSGLLRVALGAAQEQRLAEELAQARTRGLGEADLRWLDAAALRERVSVAGARGAAFSPRVARVHPAKLLAGLAAAVEQMGVAIYEDTPVREIRPRQALTAAGVVRARWVVRATEGYTAGLPGLRRALVPMNSSMIVTEPLSPRAWRQIGWEGSELLADDAHVYAYLQRTEDGRIAIGGRGVPYRFGSRTDRAGETAGSTVASLHAKLLAMFPAAGDAQLAHTWSGVLGVARDWGVALDADPATGLAWAGGYVGEGVAASNLAARALCELILERPGRLARIAWVGRRPPRWEPEPLRWAEIGAVYSLYRLADRFERRSGRPSRLGALVDRACGRR